MPSIHDLPPPDPKTRQGDWLIPPPVGSVPAGPILPPPIVRERPAARDDYTKWALRPGGVVERRQTRELKNRQDPRPTIGRDTRLGAQFAPDGTLLARGGVYEGDYHGPSITVDTESEETGALIDEAYDDIIALMLSYGENELDEHGVLALVGDYVAGRMRCDEAEVDGIWYATGGRDGRKISLGVYMNRKVGMCQQHALLCGVLLERLIDAGIMSGKMSVDRNENLRNDRYEGHAWVRYTPSTGAVMILDSANKVCASLDSLEARRRAGEDLWNYTREEDRSEVLADTLRHPSRRRDMGRVAMQEEAPEEPVSERDRLRRYYQGALAEKRKAQLAGDGEGSIYWGQQAGRYHKELLKLDGYL